MALDQALKKVQLSVEEMSHARDDGDGKCLGPRPVKNGGQGHGVIGFTMDDKRARVRGRRQVRYLEA